MTEITQGFQFSAALVGVVTCVWWYKVEARRNRSAPIMWGIWCMFLVAFRFVRWCIPPLSTDFNASANFLFILGALSVTYMALLNIGGAKHGHH